MSINFTTSSPFLVRLSLNRTIKQFQTSIAILEQQNHFNMKSAHFCSRSELTITPVPKFAYTISIPTNVFFFPSICNLKDHLSSPKLSSSVNSLFHSSSPSFSSSSSSTPWPSVSSSNVSPLSEVLYSSSNLINWILASQHFYNFSWIKLLQLISTKVRGSLLVAIDSLNEVSYTDQNRSCYFFLRIRKLITALVSMTRRWFNYCILTNIKSSLFSMGSQSTICQDSIINSIDNRHSYS